MPVGGYKAFTLSRSVDVSEGRKPDSQESKLEREELKPSVEEVVVGRKEVLGDAWVEDDDGQLVAGPRVVLVVGHELGLGGDVGGCEVRHFLRLGLDPTQGLEILEKELVLWQFRRQLNTRVAAALRRPHNCLRTMSNDRAELAVQRTLISLTCLLSAGLEPYRNPAT